MNLTQSEEKIIANFELIESILTREMAINSLSSTDLTSNIKQYLLNLTSECELYLTNSEKEEIAISLAESGYNEIPKNYAIDCCIYPGSYVRAYSESPSTHCFYKFDAENRRLKSCEAVKNILCSPDDFNSIKYRYFINNPKRRLLVAENSKDEKE